MEGGCCGALEASVVAEVDPKYPLYLYPAREQFPRNSGMKRDYFDFDVIFLPYDASLDHLAVLSV